MYKKLINLKNGYKTEGFTYIIDAILWRVPKWLFYFKHSFLLTTDKPKLITRNYPGYEVKTAEYSDIDLIKEPEIYPKEKMMNRLEKGDSCRIVFKGDKIISMIWGITTNKVFAIDCGSIVTINEDAWFVDGTFTVPEERFKGFHLTCFKSIHAGFGLKDRNRIIGIIHASNEVSLKAHKRIGFEIIGETYYYIFFGVSFCYYKKWPTKTKKLHIFIKRPPQNLEWV